MACGVRQALGAMARCDVTLTSSIFLMMVVGVLSQVSKSAENTLASPASERYRITPVLLCVIEKCLFLWLLLMLLFGFFVYFCIPSSSANLADK